MIRDFAIKRNFLAIFPFFWLPAEILSNYHKPARVLEYLNLNLLSSTNQNIDFRPIKPIVFQCRICGAYNPIYI